MARGRPRKAVTPEVVLEQTEKVRRHDPMTRIVFERLARDVTVTRIPDLQKPGAECEGVLRIVEAPLEYMFHRAKYPIAVWQYATGCLFRQDWTTAQISTIKAVDPSRGELYLTDEVVAAGGEGSRSSPRYSGPVNVADNKIDAMQRLGLLADQISNMSYWLLEKVVGEEFPLKQIAGGLKLDERYVHTRFKEALTEAASFYRLTSRPHPKQGRPVAPYHDPDLANEVATARTAVAAGGR